MPALRLSCVRGALFLGVALILNTFAQPAGYPTTPLVRNFSSKELFGSGQIWGGIQAPSGILYFGGNSFFLQYDGASWRRYKHPGQTSRHFAIDSTGRLWTGGIGTFGYLEPDANGSTHFVSLQEKIPLEHRTFADVWQILPTAHGIYFRSYARLFRWDGKRMQVWVSESRFEGLTEFQGKIYVAQGAVGLQELRGDELVPAPGGAAYKGGVRLNFVPYDDRRLLVSARNGLLSLYDGEKSVPFPTGADAFLSKSSPYNMLRLPDGAICIATNVAGLVILEPDGRLRRILNRETGLAGNAVATPFLDREGNLWLTRSDGISRVEINSPLQVYSPMSSSASTLHNGVRYIASATSGLPLVRLDRDPATGLAIAKPVQVPGTQAFALVSFGAKPGTPSTDLLAATANGVVRITGDTTVPVLPNRVGLVHAASALLRSRVSPNRIFVGHSAGVFSIRHENGSWIDEGDARGCKSRTTYLAEGDDGVLWGVGNARLVCRIEVPPTGLGAGAVRIFGPKDGAPAESNTVSYAAGEIFLSAPDGFYRFDKPSDRFVRDKRFEFPLSDLADDRFLVQLPSGDVWAYGGAGAENNQGLFRRQADGSYKLDLLTFRRLSAFQLGPPELEADNSLTLPSRDGILRFDRAERPSPPPFSTLIRQIASADGHTVFGGDPGAKLAPPNVPFEHNSLRFQFAAPTYGTEDETNYQYLLEGSDNGWSAWSTQHEANYNNLGPGQYRFRVRSRTVDGREGEEAAFSFSIAAPWYRTTLAYLAYAALLALAGYAARRQIIAREREKSRRETAALEATVAERTAVIAAQRDNIELLSEIGKEITASLELETVLFKVYERVNKFVDASVFGVGLYRPEKGVIDYDLAIENGKRYARYSRSVADKQQFAVWCVDNRKPVFINDVEAEYRDYIASYAHGKRLLEDGSQAQAPASMIYLPLIAKDRVLGVLSVQSFKRNAYTRQHLSLLENLASYTAIALDNADVYRRVATREREISTVNRINQALSTKLDSADLIHLVGEQIREVFNAQLAYVALLDRATMMLHFPYTYGEDVESRPFGDGLTSQIIRAGQPLLINQDVSGNTARLGLQNMGRQAASYLGVPIPSGGEIIGVLSVQSLEEEGRFTEADQRLLATIAASVGVAFHNARLFEDARQARAAAEEADAAKSAFLSTVSHELRTPLTSVLGFAKIIRKRLEERLFPLISDDDRKIAQTKRQIAENLDVVVSEGQRLTKLIDDVLDLAKIEAGKFTWNLSATSIPDVISRAVSATSSLFEAKKIEVRADVADDLPAIHGDADRLLQVVINLLSNAVKFTDAGSVFVSARAAGGEIVVSVKDSGIGIKPEDQPKVFEKFKQVGDTLTDKPKGTGLGLPICKEIVEFHGGRIWVESEPGQGATFSFSLPVSGVPTERPPKVNIESIIRQLRDNVASHQPRPHSVLVVDDDPHIRSLLRQELTEAGYDVRLAEDGRSALAAVREQQPGLIILDVMMPEMNGFDVAAVLKNDPSTAAIPIIILSIVEDKERGYRLGVDRYLTKPIDTAALFHEVGTLLDQGKSHKKVMIVDEDSSTIRTLAEALQARGYHVTESNGAELVDKALTAKPDIIVLNSLLSGHDTVRSLRFEKGLENVLFLIYQ